MNKQEIISSALSRSEHFSSALLQYKTSLATDEKFQNTFWQLTEDIVSCALQQNKNIKQLFFCAVGKSAQVASLATNMLISVGILARFIHPTEAFHGDLGVINENDIIVFISNNGNSSELLQLIPGLKQRLVKSYTITAKPNSPLAKQTNFVLQLPVAEEFCPLKQAPITSTLTSLALCQLLVASCIEARNFTLEDYAKNHPGGSIGKRIFLKVDDLMVKGNLLPIIAPEESFQKVISSLTHFSKGALIVQEHDKLLGLITEKDLRTAMEKFGVNVFDKKAKDIMNTKPLTFSSGSLAADVFTFMTQKKPHLNVLPIVNQEGKAEGMIHIQDLISAGFSLEF